LKKSIFISMEIVWIISAGGFGLRAAKYLLHQQKGFQVVLVDRDREKLDQAEDLDCIRTQADGIEFLNANIKPGNYSAWIVPAVPVHLAWESPGSPRWKKRGLA
jgi:NAD(P)-dependent dehydrogenase (short-subunit alcohol dehydrogenase family)